jgi:hypothetical protein
MGGQGRGVLSDFKMTRVSRMKRRELRIGLMIVVQFPYGGYGRKLAWREASQLVKRLGRERARREMYDYSMMEGVLKGRDILGIIDTTVQYKGKRIGTNVTFTMVYMR